MLLYDLINAQNVVKAAQFILSLSILDLKQPYDPDIRASIGWLQDSLEHYLQPQPQPSLRGLSSVEQLEFSLKVLLQAVKSLLPCLTDEASVQLQHVLLTQPMNKRCALNIAI